MIAALVLLSACAAPGRVDPVEYFREGTFALDELWRPAGTRYLRAMEEPSLLPRTVGEEAFRLLWIPSWEPVRAVRLTRRGRCVCSRAVVLEEDREFDFESWSMPLPRPARVLERELPSKAWDEIERLAAAAEVWHAPADDDEFVLDGWTWILEVRSGDRHRVLLRYAERRGPFVDLGVRMFQLAGLGQDVEESGVVSDTTPVSLLRGRNAARSWIDSDHACDRNRVRAAAGG